MLRVLNEATSEPVTVEELKAYLALNTTAYDTALSEAISAARSNVEYITGRSLVEKTLEYSVADHSDAYIYLPMAPISSIVSVVSIDSSGVSTTVSASDYSLVLNRLNYSGTGASVKVTYITDASSEAVFKVAVMKQVSHDYKNNFENTEISDEVFKSLKQYTQNVGY